MRKALVALIIVLISKVVSAQTASIVIEDIYWSNDTEWLSTFHAEPQSSANYYAYYVQENGTGNFTLDTELSGQGRWHCQTDNEANQYWTYYVDITLSGGQHIVSKPVAIGKFGTPKQARLYARDEYGIQFGGSIEDIGLWTDYTWHWTNPATNGWTFHWMASGDILKINPHIDDLGQKFHRGVTSQSDVRYQNYDEYPLNPTLNWDELTFHHRRSFDATIRADLIDIPSATLQVTFKDPWLEDAIGYGGESYSRGMAAPFNPHSSPWTISTTPEYHGVFLNENPAWDPTRPIYSVGAPSQFGGLTLLLQKWSGSNAVFEDSFAVQTPIVFTKSGGIATATVKAHLGSSLATTTGSPGQRKLLFSGNSGYHLVYASGGDVWYTRSTNGTTWTPEKLVSRGTGTAVNPSIAEPSFVSQDTTYIVWVDTTIANGQVKHIVYFRNLAMVTGQLQAIERTQPGPPYWARPDAAPVAVRQGAMPDYPDVSVAYEGENTGVLVTHRYYYGSNGVIWWTQPVTTSTSSGRPSICNSTDFSPFNTTLAFDNGVDVFMSVSEAAHQTPGAFYTPELVSTEILLDQNRNPVVSTDPCNNTKYLTWIGYDLDYQMNLTLVKSKSDGDWRPLQAFVDDLGNPANLTSTICADEWCGGPTLFWSDREVLVNMVSPDGKSWTVKDYSTYSGPFYYPNLPSVANEGALPSVLAKNSQPPYEVKFEMRNNGDQLQKPNEDSVLSSARHYRRVDFADSSGARLTAQFGALRLLSLDGGFIRQLEFDTSDVTERDIFLRSVPFQLTSRILLGIDLGIKALNWNQSVTVSAELIDSASGGRVAVLASARIGVVSDTTFRGRFERTISQLNGGRPMYVSLKLAGSALEMYRSSIANVMTLGNRGNLFKPQVEDGEGTPALPSEFVLHQNYPNPFNPTTEIRFDLAEGGDVSLVVYDVLGRKVVDLAEGYHAAGYYSATWDASGQASGVYFARFTVTGAEGLPAGQAGKSVYSKVNKLVLMK